MALTVEIISEFYKKFRGDFESFFAGLYEGEKAKSAIEDLSQFLTNEYLDQVIFGFLNEDGVIDPKVIYEVSIKRELTRGLGRAKEIEVREFSEDKRQRILILKLSEKFTKLDRENTLDFLRNSLFNDWSYLIDLELSGFQKKQVFFSKEQLTVQRGVKNG